MRAMLGFGLAVLLVASAAVADDDKVDAKKLVGKWEAKGLGDGESIVLEFKGDGKAALTASYGEEQERGSGSYALDGNKLSITLTVAGETETKTVTVARLTDAELVWTTKSGKEWTFVRVKDKK